MMGKVLRIAGCGLAIVVFGIAFLAHQIPQQWNLPLADLEGVVGDSTGRIFVVSSVYDRLFIYDSAGKRLNTVITPAAKGTPEIAIDDQDRVWTCKGPYLRRWTRDGAPDGAWTVDGPSACGRVKLDAKGEWTTGSPSGGNYAETLSPVRSGEVLFPHVNPALLGRHAVFVDKNGRTYAVKSRFWLGMISRHGGGASELCIWGPAALLPLAFPSPGIPLAVILVLLSYLITKSTKKTNTV